MVLFNFFQILINGTDRILRPGASGFGSLQYSAGITQNRDPTIQESEANQTTQQRFFGALETILKPCVLYHVLIAIDAFTRE